jgi:hypothetical protein
VFSIPTPYKIIVVIVLIIICTFGGYNHAKRVYKQQCENRILTFQNQLKDLKLELQKEQENIKERIVVEYVDKIKTIKEREYVYIKQIETVVPSQCELSSGWVSLHDFSATATNPDTTKTSDDSPSGVMDNQALATVVTNYSICQQNSAQLISLQKWIKESKAAVDEANSKKSK